jgi:ATP-binding cassette, subfamily B, bacterial PglK
MISQIKQLWYHLDSRRHKQFIALLMLMFFTSLLEVVSIGAIIPFLGVLISPDIIFNHSLAQPFIKLLEINNPNELAQPLMVFFIAVVIFAGVIKVLSLYLTTKFSFAIGADISIKIYRLTLYQDYLIHVNRNSSDVINGVIQKTNQISSGVFASSLTLFNAIILLFAIITALAIINAEVAFGVILVFSFFYFIVIKLVRKKIRKNSLFIAKHTTNIIKSLQEGLGGIRDVIINNSQDFYCKLYRNSDVPVRQASAENTFIGGAPKYLLEMLGMILIVLLAHLSSNSGGLLIDYIPVIGALAFASQRILPALQQSYKSYSSIKSLQYSIDDVLKLLNQPISSAESLVKPKKLDINNQMHLKNIWFRYDDKQKWILKNIDLIINKGDKIGFIGETGCGKSTLLDVVMGLITPTKGGLLVDGELIDKKNKTSWQKNIAHVPQSIFLSDSTIIENIAFGVLVDDIDIDLVKKSAKQAELNLVIEQLPQKYQTMVGERGVRLSGGQRQRIGIARALYKQANILILDEATSALDSDTESRVMKTIDNLDKDLTILIIAHRIATLKGCNKIIEVDNYNTPTN